MKIKKSRPASQSTKVRKKNKNILSFFHFDRVRSSLSYQSLINTNHSPLHPNPAPLLFLWVTSYSTDRKERVKGKPYTASLLIYNTPTA